MHFTNNCKLNGIEHFLGQVDTRSQRPEHTIKLKTKWSNSLRNRIKWQQTQKNRRALVAEWDRKTHQRIICTSQCQHTKTPLWACNYFNSDVTNAKRTLVAKVHGTASSRPIFALNEEQKTSQRDVIARRWLSIFAHFGWHFYENEVQKRKNANGKPGTENHLQHQTGMPHNIYLHCLR